MISTQVGMDDIQCCRIFRFQNMKTFFLNIIRHDLGKISNARYLNKSVTLNDAFAVAKRKFDVSHLN